MKTNVSMTIDDIDLEANLLSLSAKTIALTTVRPLSGIITVLRAPLDFEKDVKYFDTGFTQEGIGAAEAMLLNIHRYVEVVLKYWHEVDEITTKEYTEILDDNWLGDYNYAFDSAEESNQIAKVIDESNIMDSEKAELLRVIDVSDSFKALAMVTAFSNAKAYHQLSGVKIPVVLLNSIIQQVRKYAIWEKLKWNQEDGLDMTRPMKGKIRYACTDYEIT